MGRKNKKSAASKDTSEKKMTKTVHLEVLQIVRSILEKSSKPLKGIKEEWENYQELHELIEAVRERQTQFVMTRKNRSECIPAFFSWLESNGVDVSAVQIASYKEGLGLEARKDIESAEKFLKIPKKVIMTVDTAKESVLGSFMTTDRVLQTMSNVALSLHVLFESVNPGSFWKPYLDILPDSYSTPLYLTSADVELLRGSPVFADVINQYRSIARQYAYFYKLFHDSTVGVKLPFAVFTYDDYRWAVSSVMTRQNQIPSDSVRQVLALIPLWDMCNHTEGEFTTDYNLEAQCVECYALRKFDTGQQVYMYYGPRSNAELLLNNGFLHPSNSNDRMEIKLGFSKTDPLYIKKCDLLSRLSLLPSGRFHLHKGDDPVDSELLAYLRVFHMNQAELEERQTGSKRDRVGKLRDFGELVSAENEMKCWKFLDTRCKLLIKAYPNTYLDDRELLQGDSLADSVRSLVQLRYMEKCLLQSTVEYIDRYLQELEITLQEEKVEALKLASRESRAKAVQQSDTSQQAPAASGDNSDDDDVVDLDAVTALSLK